MPRLSLMPHPDTPCSAITCVAADVASAAKALEIRYFVAGDVSTLRIPPRSAATFTDELWRHTCFELFIASEIGQSYYEFNFSPSSAWAAYRFPDYGAGMTSLSQIAAPHVMLARTEDELRLTATIALEGIGLARQVPLAIPTVLEQ